MERVIRAMLVAASLCDCGGRTQGLLYGDTRSLDAGTRRNGAGTVPADAGKASDDALEKITMVVLGASGGWPSPCNINQNDVFIYDARTNNFSWDFCAWDLDTGDSASKSGYRTLTRFETYALLNTLSLMREGAAGSCSADAPLATLDVEMGATTKHFIADGDACSFSTPEGIPFIGTGQLMGWFWALAYETQLPTSFDGFTLRGRPIFDPLRDPSTGCDDTFRDEYKVDATTRQLTWRHCLAKAGSTIYHAYEGSKRLSVEEYGSLLEAVSQLELGNSGPCGEILPYAYVTFDVPTYLGTFVAETEACRMEPESSSNLYTVHIDQLRTKLRALAY